MKTNIFLKGLASLLTAGMLVGCSSDYLQVDPVTGITTSTVQSTQEGAQAALYGLCRAMYCQYSSYGSYMSPNGESYTAMLFGDVMGQDYFSYFWGSRLGAYYRFEQMFNQLGWPNAWAWAYYYNLVNQANVILQNIDNIDGDRDRLNFIKGEALTIRSHAFVRLLQIFGPRWSDSNEGRRMAIVMRLTPEVGDCPLSSVNDVLNRVYEDLDLAISLMEGNKVQRSYIWEVDEDVARGIYARAALLKNDWPKAQEMANLARRYYPIMSAEEYQGGFAEANKEYMWANSTDVTGVYYWAHGSWYACQGAYVDWGDGVGAINYDLYRQIPAKDIRANLYFTPDKLITIGGISMSKASFWNPNICDEANMNLYKKNANMQNQLGVFGRRRIPNGDVEKWKEPYVARGGGSDADMCIPFGAQYKFWGLDDFGTNAFPYMRGAEMLLTEAEAACHNKDEKTAKECLKELNEQRNPSYNCDKLSGEALLAEVKLQRRIELWGEGFNFFDLKRWNEPLVRNVWKARDTNSNNIPQAYGITVQPSAASGWRYAIPQRESQYNNALDRTLLE